MTQADYAADSHMRPTEVKKYYDGAVYMKKFLKFIGASENNFNIIKESKVWSLFYEMGKSLSKNFGDDPESQVRKNETMNSYFGVILPFKLKCSISIAHNSLTEICNPLAQLNSLPMALLLVATKKFAFTISFT